MGIKKICHARLRTYDCPACGRYIDRNWNASVNILNWEPSAARGIADSFHYVPLNSVGSKLGRSKNSFR
ncbi:hypothetical protein [Microcoleus sp. D3_18_C4]|uniref:hypothetical protein n=1 Tax=Microcoleus sp. D3_18_C4 TaxID=3055335 RepID=UPI004040A0C1